MTLTNTSHLAIYNIYCILSQWWGPRVTPPTRSARSCGEARGPRARAGVSLRSARPGLPRHRTARWGKSRGTFQPRAEDKDFNTSQHRNKIFFNIRNILGNIFKSICHYLWLTSSFSQSQKKTNPYSFEKFHFKLISPLRVSSRHLRILTWGWRLNSPSSLSSLTSQFSDHWGHHVPLISV